MTSPSRRNAVYPSPVVAVIDTDWAELVGSRIDENLARQDDAFWARMASRLWVTPQGFLNWWIARRWVIPRDIRKE